MGLHGRGDLAPALVDFPRVQVFNLNPMFRDLPAAYYEHGGSICKIEPAKQALTFGIYGFKHVSFSD